MRSNRCALTNTSHLNYQICSPSLTLFTTRFAALPLKLHVMMNHYKSRQLIKRKNHCPMRQTKCIAPFSLTCQEHKEKNMISHILRRSGWRSRESKTRINPRLPKEALISLSRWQPCTTKQTVSIEAQRYERWLRSQVGSNLRLASVAFSTINDAYYRGVCKLFDCFRSTCQQNVDSVRNEKWCMKNKSHHKGRFCVTATEHIFGKIR